jgi:hypothetical protein
MFGGNNCFEFTRAVIFSEILTSSWNYNSSLRLGPILKLMTISWMYCAYNGKFSLPPLRCYPCFHMKGRSFETRTSWMQAHCISVELMDNVVTALTTMLSSFIRLLWNKAIITPIRQQFRYNISFAPISKDGSSQLLAQWMDKYLIKEQELYKSTFGSRSCS